MALVEAFAVVRGLICQGFRVSFRVCVGFMGSLVEPRPVPGSTVLPLFVIV